MTNRVRVLHLTSSVSKMPWQFCYRIFLYIFNLSSLNFNRLRRMQSRSIIFSLDVFVHLIFSFVSYFSYTFIAVFCEGFSFYFAQLIKDTLMQKFPYVFVFILKRYTERFAFLILRMIELFTREFCKILKK